MDSFLCPYCGAEITPPPGIADLNVVKFSDQSTQRPTDPRPEYFVWMCPKCLKHVKIPK